MYLLGGESERMSSKIRAVVFFLVSTALLVIYSMQQGKITTQGGIWIGVIVVGTAASFTIKDSDLVSTVIMALMGLSGGMVLGNTTITLK